MTTYLLQRMLGACVVIFGVSCVVFLLLHLVPGDPVDVMLGESARSADVDSLRRAFGLHESLFSQFINYFKALGRLDLGLSLMKAQPVLGLIVERLPATLYLSFASLIVALAISLPLGVVAALHRGTVWDYGAMGFSLFGLSIPNFWLGPLLILVFAVELGWFPVSGRDAPGSIVLPALTLGTAMAAILSRMIRSSLLEVLEEDYIRTAKAKGLSLWQVLFNHALRNTLLPLLTLLGLQLGALLGGAVITETVFSWPGIGLLTIDAIQTRDYPLVQGCILFISLFYVLVNIATDLLYALIDPRIRFAADSHG